MNICRIILALIACMAISQQMLYAQTWTHMGPFYKVKGPDGGITGGNSYTVFLRVVKAPTPGDSSYIYAANGNGLHLSKDGGSTFALIPTTPSVEHHTYFSSTDNFAVSRTNVNKIVKGHYWPYYYPTGVAFYSIDGGKNWKRETDGLPNSGFFQFDYFEFDPFNENIIYGASTNGVFMLDISQANPQWVRPFNSGETNAPPELSSNSSTFFKLEFAYSTTDPNNYILYAQTSTGVFFRKKVGGVFQNWKAINMAASTGYGGIDFSTAMGAQNQLTIAAHPNALYAVLYTNEYVDVHNTKARLYRYDLTGNTGWNLRSNQVFNIYRDSGGRPLGMKVKPNDPNKVFLPGNIAGTSTAMYVWDDLTSTSNPITGYWTHDCPASHGDVLDMAFDPVNPQFLYHANDGMVTKLDVNYGIANGFSTCNAAFVNLNCDGLSGNQVLSIGSSYQTPNRLMISCWHNNSYSYDGTLSDPKARYKCVENGTDENVGANFFVNDNLIIGCHKNGPVRVYSNAWTGISNADDFKINTSSGFVYLAITPGNFVRRIVRHPSNPSIVYIAQANGIYVSNSITSATVNSFTQIANFSSSVEVDCIDVFFGNANEVYAGCYDGTLNKTYVAKGVFNLATQTWTWSQYGSPLPVNASGSTTLKSIAVDPVNNSHMMVLYNADASLLLNETTDGGVTWNNSATYFTNMNLPTSDNARQTDLVVEHASNGRFYLSTYVGVYYRDNTMTSWQRYGASSPDILAGCMNLNHTFNQLYVGTGGGLWSVPLLCPSTDLTLPSSITRTYYEGNNITASNSNNNASTSPTQVRMTSGMVFLPNTVITSNANTSFWAYIKGCSNSSPSGFYRMDETTTSIEPAGDNSLVPTEKEDSEKGDIVISPNPSHGPIKVSSVLLKDEVFKGVQVMDEKGVVLKEVSEYSQEIEINMGSLMNHESVYIVHFLSNKRNVSKKVYVTIQGVPKGQNMYDLKKGNNP